MTMRMMMITIVVLLERMVIAATMVAVSLAGRAMAWFNKLVRSS